jgi:hypothetical protein
VSLVAWFVPKESGTSEPNSSCDSSGRGPD